MKHYISEKEWLALEKLLMRAEIPYHVSFDSHVTDSPDVVIYDKYIQIDPFTIQKKEVKCDGESVFFT